MTVPERSEPMTFGVRCASAPPANHHNQLHLISNGNIGSGAEKHTRDAHGRLDSSRSRQPGPTPRHPQAQVNRERRDEGLQGQDKATPLRIQTWQVHRGWHHPRGRPLRPSWLGALTLWRAWCSLQVLSPKCLAEDAGNIPHNMFISLHADSDKSLHGQCSFLA